jgi:nucleoside-diphosphate-sugar epimerase
MNVLIAGAHGTSGHSIAASFNASPEIKLTTLSRRAQSPTSSPHIALDLLNADSVRDAAAKLSDTEVLVFSARAPGNDPENEAFINLKLLQNLVSVIDEKAPKLKRVCLIHGTKWYGCHVGPYRIPAREFDVRGAGPLFYFDQYDWLKQQATNRRWDIVTLRPHTVWGYSKGTRNNLITLIAAYAAIQRERGKPLDFPGPVETYFKKSQATTATLLGKCAVWAVQSEAAANKDFNITNGDTFSWRNLWPRIAQLFNMPLGDPGRTNFTAEFDGAQAVWQHLAAKHQLVHQHIDEIASATYGDGLFSCSWDDVSSLEAIRNAGWNESLDSESEFLEIIRALQQAKVAPL